MASDPSIGYVEPSTPVRAGIGLTTLVANSFASYFPADPRNNTINITSHGAVAGNTGVNNRTAIAAAIAAASSGDEVFIPNGIWYCSTGDIPLKTGVNVRFESRSAILRYRSGSNATNLFGHSSGSSRAGLTDIRIYGGTIDRDAALAGVVQHPLRFGQGSSGSGGFTPNQRIYVADMDIAAFEKYAITMENVKWGFVWGCTMRDATAWGGGGQGYGVNLSGPSTEECWIVGNTLGSATGVMRHGLLVQFSAHNNLFELNNARRFTNDVYDTHGEDEHSNEIRFNTAIEAIRNHASCSGGVCYPSGVGIGEYGAGTGGVGDHDNSGPNNWVYGNTISGNYYAGVRVGGGPTNPTIGTIVENNEIYGCTYGVRVGDLSATLGGGFETEILYNNIHENSYGIQLVNADDSIVRCNHSVDNSVRNLDVTSACNGATITDNNFRRGTVTNAGTNGIYTNNATGSTALPDPDPCPDLVAVDSIASDDFTRTVSNDWGTADVGGTYTLVGTAADFDVNGTQGTILQTTSGNSKAARLDSVSVRDAEVLFSFVMDGVMTGNNMSAYFTMRNSADVNWYGVRCYMQTDGLVDMVVARRVNSVEVAVGSAANNLFTYTTGTRVNVRFQVSGTGTTTLRAKAWKDADTEPSSWQIDTTDTVGPQSAGSLGVRQYMPGTGPHTVAYDGFEVFSLTAAPSCAVGTGLANNAGTTKVATAESTTATATGAANNAGKSISRAAGQGTGTGAVASTGRSVSREAGLGSGTGAMNTGSLALYAPLEYAFGVGESPDIAPTGSLNVPSSAASATGSAANATTDIVDVTEPGLTIQMGMG